MIRHLSHRLVLVALSVALLVGVIGGAIPVGAQPKTTAAGSDSAVNQLVHDAEIDLTTFWAQTFKANGLYYLTPSYSSFASTIQTPCGKAQPGDGPFYCGLDQTVYLDATFIGQVDAQFGPLAVVVVIAHETGHNVQAQLGVNSGADPSIQVELQADCLAGVYVAHLVTDEGVPASSVESALPFIAASGDDPRSVPATAADAHGLGPQRELLFERGLTSGLAGCSTI